MTTTSDSNGFEFFLPCLDGEQPKHNNRDERIIIDLMIETKNGLFEPTKVNPTDRSVNFISLILFSLRI